MSVATLYHLHGLLLPSEAFISQLTDTSPDTGIEDLLGYGAGHPDPLFTAAAAVTPRISFTSTQIATILTACGASFALDTSGGNTDLFYKKALDLGVRTADATEEHLRLRVTQGLLYWTQIQAQQGQAATIAAQLVPTWDGTNNPIIPAGSVALSGTPTSAEHFTLGPVKLNGSMMGNITGWSLDLGITPTEAASDGEPFLSFAGIQQRAPMLTLTSTNAALWTSLGQNGIAVTALVAYLRRRTADGVNYADGGSNHIALTATNGRAYIERASGGGNAPKTVSIKIPLRAASASGAVLTVATTSTIA